MRLHVYYQISENNAYLIYFNKTAEPKHQLSFSTNIYTVLENTPALKKRTVLKTNQKPWKCRFSRRIRYKSGHFTVKKAIICCSSYLVSFHEKIKVI